MVHTGGWYPAAAAMRYRAGKHEIRVLDDSTDETCGIVERVAAELAATGTVIRIIRRNSRKGFKSGAQAAGMASARGELITVFDADFVPPRDYLLRTAPFFVEDSRLGLLQARGGHINRHRSMLTRAQAIGIDGHFMIEQAACNWNGLFMNFNGTAGLYCAASLGVYLVAGKYLVGPFLCIYAAGFLLVGLLSVAYSAGRSR
jgi:cellulose synthase/poly-beta-1,6-N-acetylglucosamine synthase-like glycosyltransferase